MITTRQKSFNSSFLLPFLTILPLCFSTSCGDDNLGGAFRAREKTPDDAKYGPASPLKVGTEHWYTLITAYKRTAENDSGGLTQHEVQGAGHLCVKIDQVKDIHTEEFKDEPETLVVGKVKISGPSGDTQMFVSDQDDANATADDVDPLLANLWLKRLVGPSAAHGYETPKTVNFRTQVAPIPTNFSAGLSILPFFEIRQLATDLGWSGWTSLGGELEGARNLTNEILSYFQQDPFELEFMASSARFKTKITTPPTDCYGHCLVECNSADACEEGFTCNLSKGACIPDEGSPTGCTSSHTCPDSDDEKCFEWFDPTSCASRNCTWAQPVNNNINSCIPLSRIGFAWRDTIRAPDEQAGNILHYIEFMYYDNGTLYKATEDIRPDTLGPETSLSANFPEATCALNCQSGDLSIKGGFNDDPSYPAPCSF